MRLFKILLISIMLYTCSSTDKNIKTNNSSHISIEERIKVLKEIEKQTIYTNNIVDSSKLNTLVMKYEELIHDFPEDSLSSQYYYKLSMFYSMNANENKALHVSENLMQKCSKGLQQQEKKYVLQNIISIYDMNQSIRDTIKLKYWYNELLKLDSLSQDEKDSYEQRIQNLHLNFEEIISQKSIQ